MNIKNSVTKICRDCKHCRIEEQWHGRVHACHHPALITIDLVDGEVTSACRNLREAVGEFVNAQTGQLVPPCGPAGLLWEQANVEEVTSA